MRSRRASGFRGEREKDRKVVTTAFGAYTQMHAEFEQRLIAIVACGDADFVKEHSTDFSGHYWWFMTQNVDQALKDRAPVRVRANETSEQTETLDKLEASSVSRAISFLEREAYYLDLQQAYRQGLLSAYNSMGEAVRIGLCSNVQQYEVDVLGVVERALPPSQK
jgi:hypothetical protein